MNLQAGWLLNLNSEAVMPFAIIFKHNLISLQKKIRRHFSSFRMWCWGSEGYVSDHVQ